MMNIHARQVERLHVVPAIPLPVLPPMTPNTPATAPMQCVDCNRKTWRRHQHVEDAPLHTSNVVAMLREATKRGNHLALAAGAVLGGASSVALYTELHPLPPLLSIPAAIRPGHGALQRSQRV